MLWPDGQWYVGQWRRDKQNFQGAMAYADGRKYVGNWKDDVMTGQGTMTYPDGRKYVGQWKDGAPERDFAKEERSRKAAEEERLRKAAEAERLGKAAEAERDSESKSLLIILLFGIAAIFLVIKILRPSKDTEGAVVSPHIEPKQLDAESPAKEVKTKNTFDWKTMSWLDRLCFGIAAAAVGGFLADVGTTLAMGMSVDLYRVFTSQLVGVYVAFPFAMWRLFSRGFFNRWLSDSSGPVELKSAVYQPELDLPTTTKNAPTTSAASEALSTQGSKSSDELQPLKMIQAAQLADEVSTAADIDSVIQVASILSSEKEVMQAVQEANEDLRDVYETKVKDLFEKQGIDRKSLTAKAIESEVNRCMKLGLNKICLDERLVPLLGSQD